MSSQKLNLKNNQSGFASIVIAIILVIVLSLITVGFAQLMRREQREAVDKQLSSQAYDAAESGVNVAIKALSDGFSGTKTSCVGGLNPSTGPGVSDFSDQTAQGSVGNPSTNGAYYTCLLVNPSPTNIQYGDIQTNPPKVVEATGQSGGSNTSIDQITVSWQAATNPSSLSTNADCNQFVPGSAWTYQPVLQFEVIPIDNLSRSALMASSFTSFMCPSASGSNSISYSAGSGYNNSAAMVSGNCSSSGNPYRCNATITGLGGTNHGSLVLVMNALYEPASVNLALYGPNCSVGCPTPLSVKGVQAQIDSTGKAQDVLRRIVARVPLQNSYNFPVGTLGGDICKQLQVMPNDVSGNNYSNRYGVNGSDTNCSVPSIN